MVLDAIAAGRGYTQTWQQGQIAFMAVGMVASILPACESASAFNEPSLPPPMLCETKTCRPSALL